MSLSFHKDQSLGEFQEVIAKIYSLPDDRLYSLWDLLTQQQRFSMRTLKGIRKHDNKQIKFNLLISLSWSMSLANRLHIDLDDEIWKRFPDLCSYCGKQPCACRESKPSKRKNVKVSTKNRPNTILKIQEMFERIYPSSSRTLADAGIHFAEEMGELAESIHNFAGQHRNKLFSETKSELADYLSCLIGVANSAKINIAEELEKMFYRNCHVCHKAPCICSFSSVASYNV